MTPTAPISIERRDLAMICGDGGRFANAENLLSQSARFFLSTEEAAAIIDAMEKTIKTAWYKTARAEGVSERDCAAIAGAFAYEGFRMEDR